MENDTAAQADFSFVHFTDTHIMAGGKFTHSALEGEYDTEASLRRVIDVISALEPRPAFAVVGGDLVSPDLLDRSKILTPEEYEPSYHLLQELLSPLQCPIHMLMGNHDNRTAFHRVMGTSVCAQDAHCYYSFEHQGYRFVVLDSQQPGKVWGHLDTEQLMWLRADIEAHRNQPTLVFVHHNPWPLGIEWLDAVNLHNGEELVRLLRDYSQVRCMVCGHVHLDQTVQQDGLTMLTTPSTCFQFSKLSQTRRFLPGPPGFRLVQVKGMNLSTRVLHLRGAGITEL